MARGRKPLPVATRKLRGNSSGKKIPRQIAGVGDAWSPPEYFRKPHRDQWDYALATAPRGLLTGTDRNLLAAWCIASVNYSVAVKALAKEDMVVETSSGILIPHALVNIMNKQAEMMIRLSDKLGFSPAARASLYSRGAEVAGLGAQTIEGSVVGFIEEKPASLAA